MARQAGMTLIELTVVLLVLIGLAGLMIPYVSGFVSKTHDSTGSNNLAQLNSTIQRYQLQAMRFPGNLQTLVDVSGVTYEKLMQTAAGVYVPAEYTAGDISSMSLRGAGITELMQLNQTAGTFDGASATFNAAEGTSLPVGMMGGTTVDVLTVGLGAENAVGTDNYGSIELHLADATGQLASNFNATCNDYVILGVGQENSMIGTAMTDAPVHFAQNGNMGPDNNYNRFVAVFEVDKANGLAAAAATSSVPPTLECGDSTHAAKFVGTAMLMMPPHLFGLAHELGHAYSNIAAQ